MRRQVSQSFQIRRNSKTIGEAATTDREIEIELEVVTARTTRMRTVAKKGSMVMDSATANEIIAQTGKVLGV